MNRRSGILRTTLLTALLSLAVAAFGCGGGGGGTPPDMGGFQSTFTGDAVPAGDIGMQAGPAPPGGDFDVDIVVAGPFDGFFGAGLRVSLPPNVDLRVPGFTSAGSFLTNATVPPAQGFTFNALQLGNEVIISATRQQGQNNTYVPGVDVAAATTEVLITLHLTATAATAGDLDLVLPRQIETCDDATETCSAVADGSLTWGGGSLLAN